MVISVRNEARRVAALRATEILDTPPAEEFDALCRVAATSLGLPIARISLVDETRQWLKAAFGTERGEMARALAFCSRTIETDEVLVVEDVELDPRFAGCAAANAEPPIRFYAGAPIVLPGRQRIGAVCVMDHVPGRLAPEGKQLLKDLARAAAALIRGHGTARNLQRDRAKLNRQIAKLARQERDLTRRDRMLLQTESMAQLGGWEWDVKKQSLRMSDGMYRVLGHDRPAREIPQRVLHVFPPGSQEMVQQAVREAAETGRSFDLQVEFVTASGEVRWGRVIGEVECDGTGPQRIFGTFQDVTQNRTLHQSLWVMANYDDMTGLAKRARFTELFEDALQRAEENGDSVGLLVIDLDHFKQVNDTLGHRAGDAMLTVTARRLKACVTEDDAVARLGGDEFAVLLHSVADRQELMAIARHVVQSVAEPIEFENENLSPGASVGCALGPADGASADVLMQNADMALYRAKTRGRGSACLFEPAMRAAVQSRIEQISTFRGALESGRIVPYYQPQMRLRDNAISGFEALARWQRPDGRIATPQEFQHALDDAEACVQLGLAILDQVARDLKKWMEAGYAPDRIAVNATSPELMRGDYPERVMRIFDGHGVPLHLLTIEVTENVFLGQGAGRVEQALRKLREMGAAIALDDFGTGFASLTHLKTYPVDKIKIDRSFITGLGQSAEDQAIVTAIMHLARSLGIRTIAEGVETEDQLTFLRVMACDGMQGFLLGHATPANEVPSFLRSRHASLIA